MRSRLCARSSRADVGSLRIAFWLGLVISTAAGADGPNEFLDLSLKDLMSLEITSVSKRPQRLSQAAAAVFVISQDDIRRSGATSIPEALRMAPGVQVARIDGNKWAVTARGFGRQFANKLLVLIDGRVVYTPSFGGVFWDVQDTLLDDVERIEVIRGPGAALWGSNAVNGVINVITKAAKNTNGALISAGAGNQERGFIGARFGGKLGENATYRVFGKFFERAPNSLQSEAKHAEDGSSMFRGGFRTDWAATDRDTVTTQGDYYNGESGQTSLAFSPSAPYARLANFPQRVSGFNLLSRWQHELSETDDWTLQTYFDRTERGWNQANLIQDTLDIDGQYRTRAFEGHDLVLGLGLRNIWDQSSDDPRMSGAFKTVLTPRNMELRLFSAFLQDDIELIPGQLTLTLGSRLEHFTFTGIQVQPNARLLWSPTPKQSVWASVARAVRMPSRGERGVNSVRAVIPPGTGLNTSPLPVVNSIVGSRQFQAEELLAYELGYKQQVTDNLSFDLALFYNHYTRLLAASVPGAICQPNGGTLPNCLLGAQYLDVPTVLNARGNGDVYGLELNAEWQPLAEWRLQGSYSLAGSDLNIPSGAPAASLSGPSGYNSNGYGPPPQMISLRSQWNPRTDVDVDVWMRYMDRLSLPFDIPPVRISSYVQLDARLAWRPLPKLELSVVGQNLLDNRQPEFYSELGDIPIIEIQRSFYGQVRWEF